VQFRERELDAVVTQAVEEWEILFPFGLEIVQSEALEVGEQDIAWGFVLSARTDEVADVSEGLALGGIQRVACGFVLYQQLSWPEEVDETGSASEAADGLLEGSDDAPGDAEDIEEFIPECLLVRLLAGRS